MPKGIKGSGPAHGNTRYTKGCRCNECTEAMRVYARQYRDRNSIRLAKQARERRLSSPKLRRKHKTDNRVASYIRYYLDINKSRAQKRANTARYRNKISDDKWLKITKEKVK